MVTNMTKQQTLKIKPILAYAIVKAVPKKSGKHYTNEYKLNGYDIFVDNHVEVNHDEKLIRVKITPYAKTS